MHRRDDGFTLIELMIVVVIIGILAAIAVPNYISLQEKSRRGSCISNQRNIYEAALLYAHDQDIANTTINLTTLTTWNYSTNVMGECPNSDVLDYDDYAIVINNYRVPSITCQVVPAGHAWTPPQ